MSRRSAVPEAKSVETDPKAAHPPVLQRLAISDEPVLEVPSIVQEVLQSSGKPLDPQSKSFFEPKFAQDFSQVRIHTDAKAAASAQAIHAHAYTVGRDIIFGAGRFDPGSQSGKRLIAHELTHTVQQRGVSKTAARSARVSQPGDSLEQQAHRVADNIMAGKTIAEQEISSTGPLIARLEAPPVQPVAAPAPSAPEPAQSPAENPAPSPVEVYSLSKPTFEPSTELKQQIEQAGSKGVVVPVALGNLARGSIKVRKNKDKLETFPNQGIELNVPALEPLKSVGVSPILAVEIENTEIKGHATVRIGKQALGEADSLAASIREHGEALGWMGMDISKMPTTESKLSNGILSFQVDNFSFTLGGVVAGTGSFGFIGEKANFSATGKITVPKLSPETFTINQDADGQLSAQAKVPVHIANFSGNLDAQYSEGTVNIEGKAGYETEKLSGEVTLLVTDADTARNVATKALGPDAIRQSAHQGAQEKTEQPKKGRGKSKPEPRAVAGFGTLNFSFTDWMTGQATVVIDNEGHVTIVGEIAPPAEVELFKQRDMEPKELAKLEVRAAYGVPIVGNVFVFANVGLSTFAKFGPGKIYNIKVKSKYSTDPTLFNEFSMEGTLNISAAAGIKLRAEGGAGVEIADHDIKVGVGLEGTAGVRGYVEATPTIGFREVADPEAGKKGEFYIKGHMELVAQPFLGLSGDLFVELDSPWWSPAPDKKWKWPVGNLEYPLPGEFGIGADVEYVLGSDQLPELQFSEVNFSPEKFMTDMVNDHVPPKQSADQEKQGEWKEGETTGEPAKEPQLNAEGAPQTTEPGRAHQEPDEELVIAPAKLPDWQRGMEHLGQLAEESTREPLDRPTLEARLAQIKAQDHFTRLRVEEAGEDWLVYPSMNPTPKKPLLIEGKAGSASKDKAEQKSQGVINPTVGTADIDVGKGQGSKQNENPLFPIDPHGFSKVIGKTPAKIGTTPDGTIRVVWEPDSNTRIRYESHPGGLTPNDPGFNPRHHGEHYHIEVKPSNLTWSQAKNQGKITKVKPQDYAQGMGTGHLPGEKIPNIITGPED